MKAFKVGHRVKLKMDKRGTMHGKVVDFTYSAVAIIWQGEREAEAIMIDSVYGQRIKRWFEF